MEILRSMLIPALLVLAMASGCTSAPTPGRAPTPGGELAGGMLATFAVDGDTFNVWVSNPETIAGLEALARGTSEASVPSGPILPGAGIGDHNSPWSWHFDPAGIEMAEVASPECDRSPGYVEQHLEEMLETIGRYCPARAGLLVITEYP